MPVFQIRPFTPVDCDWVNRVMIAEWSAEIVVVNRETFHPADLPGFAACVSEDPIRLLTNIIDGYECEIITLNSWHFGFGVSAALIDAAWHVAGRSGCRRLFLVTTNNNLYALHFYQKRGFFLSAVRINAIAESRKLKPQIPLMDQNGLPIRDEIELEMLL